MHSNMRHRLQEISSASASSISSLHEDIMADIIGRLTVKDMATCMCVSKHWHSFISKLCFPRITSALHGLRYRTRYYKSGVSTRTLWHMASISSTPYNHRIHIRNLLPFTASPKKFLDCYNGLDLYFDPSSMQYYICNSSIRQFRAISNSPRNNVPKTAALILDPHLKIVHISGSPATMNIYSSAMGKWSVHKLDKLDMTAKMPSRYVFLDGSLYRNSGAGYLLKFNVTKEIGYGAIELPEIAKMNLEVGCLGVSQGSLHFGWDDQSSNMMIWMLNSANEWVLKHNISLQYFAQHSLCKNLQDPSVLDVVTFHPTCDKFFVGNCSGIFCYDPVKEELETVVTESCIEKFIIYGGQDLSYTFFINLTSLDVLLKGS
ncbi:hypothetical protein ACHQM5_016040 [Ranunculus cassubicifolius]